MKAVYLVVLICVVCFLIVMIYLQRQNVKEMTLKPSNKLHVIIVATEPDRSDQLLASLANKKGYVVHTRGMGEVWTGYDFKLRHTLKLAKELPPDAILMHLDAYDTYILTDASEVLRKFKGLDANIVVSTETNLAPTWEFGNMTSAIDNMYPSAPNRFRWINSGTYIGYAGAIANFLSSMPPDFYCDMPTGEKSNTSDDQRCFHTHFLREGTKHDIKLDYNQDIFHCMWGVDKYSMEPKRIHSETGSMPCIIHGNGRAPSFSEVVNHIKLNNK